MKYDGGKQIKDGYFVLATDKKVEHLIRENSKKDYKLFILFVLVFVCVALLFFLCVKNNVIKEKTTLKSLSMVKVSFIGKK